MTWIFNGFYKIAQRFHVMSHFSPLGKGSSFGQVIMVCPEKRLPRYGVFMNMFEYS
jgi:hypothetical protein